MTRALWKPKERIACTHLRHWQPFPSFFAVTDSVSPRGLSGAGHAFEAQQQVNARFRRLLNTRYVEVSWLEETPRLVRFGSEFFVGKTARWDRGSTPPEWPGPQLAARVCCNPSATCTQRRGQEICFEPTAVSPSSTHSGSLSLLYE